MPDTVENSLMLIAAVEFSMGIFGNVFIAVVNFMDWIKKRKIASIDLILTSLAISRICLLCIILLDCFILVLYPDIYTAGKQMRIIDFFWTLTNHLSVWFATCLSIFYFLKIANFFHPLFLWMKWRIGSVIPRILLGCLALSVFISLPVIDNLNDDFRGCVKAKWKRNLTLRCRVNKGQYASIKICLNLLTLFPLSVSLISFFLLIFSLWRHKRQMQLSATGDPNIEAHVGAMKAIISFLLLFLVYYLAFLIATSSYFMPETELAVTIGELIALIYPSSHSFILILGNNKLKQASLRVLWKIKYILKRRHF
ncbi:taste receptor type 2 member 7-like [Manis javanica]|uniref:taste receptor type 2 member 7-like n=1 Tax=Manis javanica TaxID=9974 RepID=UPI000813A021|nr:taste receptor type 2 member 7-like [Manis javanica]XP_036864662.1 taste receptor type 2 member 7-like [Manis javanica]XP_036864663.1 taste receptor type 2 member 7-like [Manis javanica]KAI5930175.1 Taste receptor type 2 member 7 [Manis javanica]